MIIKSSNNKIIDNAMLLDKRKALLFCCSLWVLCGLLFVQLSPLSAMKPDEAEKKRNPDISQKNKRVGGTPSKVAQTKPHKNTTQPSKQAGEPKSDLLERSNDLKNQIEIIKKQIIYDRINPNIVVTENLKKSRSIFICSECMNKKPLPSSGLPHTNFLLKIDDSKSKETGSSGAEIIHTRDEKGNHIVIKKFIKTIEKPNQIEEGLKDLMCSLVASSLNPYPKELQMVGIDHAVLCPEMSLSIFMRAARGQDITKFLGGVLAKPALKAFAKFLATWHIKNYELNEQMNVVRGKYLNHIAEAYSTLLEKLPGDKEQLTGDKKGIKLLSFDSASCKGTPKNVTSNDILQSLDNKTKYRFIELVKITCKNFKNNVAKVYRSLRNPEKNRQYFLTINLGDAHGKNFFYDPSDKRNIKQGKLERVESIDFGSSVKTCGNIGDPTEDKGRFEGSLWEWAAQTWNDPLVKDKSICSYERILDLQNEFSKKYLKKIFKSNIIKKENQKAFKRIFKDNCNFYKLRFYRVIFNSKQSPEIKKTLLNFWIRENTEPGKQRNKIEQLPKMPMGNLIYYDPPEGFIESAPTESSPTYLKQLQVFFQPSGMAVKNSPPRIAVVTGMPGVGKTSLALEYAHNPLYSFVYWLTSKTENDLIEGYKKLLKKTDPNVADSKDNKGIIEKFNQCISNKKGKRLLIYDNVPNSSRFLEFLKGGALKDILPKETDILITSRNKAGWENQLCKPKVIKLNVFRRNESKKYLETITGLEKGKKIDEIAKELGDHPLGISHAAHYIILQEDGSKVSEKTCQQYLDAFHKDPRTRNVLEEPRPKITYKYFVETTLRMSDIREAEAAEVIKILESVASCNPSSIKDIKEEALVWIEKTKREKALAQLSSLSLIKRDRKKQEFSIHPLVWLVVREEITKDFDQRHNTAKVNTRWIIKSTSNGKVLDNFGPLKADVGVWEELRNYRQQWNIIRHNQNYIIKSADREVNGQVLDNFSAKNAKIGLWEDLSKKGCNDRQLWNIIKHNHGYIIKSADREENGQVLDNHQFSNQEIGIKDEHNNDSCQLWLILEK